VNFNLIDEPFIPCLLPDGTRRECGLKETLLRAHEIHEIRDESPLVTVALHRLLLAVLHRNFGLESLAAWKRLWQAGRFDAGRLAAYFDRWRDRFDLFDSARPFYQTGGMSTKTPPLPVAALFDERACNNNATLFDHSWNDGGRAASPAEAARGLAARQGFALGLGVSPDVTINGGTVKTGNRKDGPLARGLLLLVRSDNLFQTLLCNLTQYDSKEDDAPVWERDDPEALVGRPRADGRLDLYTFQCRRLQLAPAPGVEPPAVTHVHFAQGRAPHPDEIDPMKAYRRDEKRGWEEFSIKKEKAVWRDSSALLELASDPERPALALNWLARAAADGVVPRHAVYNLDTFAVGAKPGKATSIILWRHDRMPLPLAYLGDRALLEQLKLALAVTEDAARALRGSSWLTACRILAPNESPKPDTDRVRAMVDALAPERLYWSRLEVPFRKHLVDLPGDGSSEHQARMLSGWTFDVLRPTALRAFDETAGRLDQSARVLRAVAVGRRSLGSELTRIAEAHRISSPPSKEPAHA
jgi:CRISPR system Cascade subunit CasA